MDKDQEYLNKVKAQLMLEKNPQGNESRENQRILFRNVFLADAQGKEVLQILLKELLYTEKISCLPELALHNVAVGIMDIMGMDGTTDFINKL